MFITASTTEGHLSSLWAIQIPQIRCKRSAHVRGGLFHFVTRCVFMVRRVQPFAQPQIWRTTPCLLSATAYLLYSQVPSIPGGYLLHRQLDYALYRDDIGPILTYLVFVYCLLFIVFFFRGKEFIPGLVPQCIECTRHGICVNNALWVLGSK
jgi:hypothetical protein